MLLHMMLLSRPYHTRLHRVHRITDMRRIRLRFILKFAFVLLFFPPKIKGYVPLLKIFSDLCTRIDSSYQISVKLLYLLQDMYLKTHGLFPPYIWTARSLYRSFCNMSTDSVYCCFTWPGFLCLRSYHVLLSLLLTLFYQFISQLSLHGGLFTFRFKTSTSYFV